MQERTPPPVAAVADVADGRLSALRGQVLGVPAPAVLAWAGLGAMVVAVCLAVAVRGEGALEALELQAARPDSSASAAVASAAPSAAEQPQAAASRAELDGASAAGAVQLAALAEKYPTDAGVLRALLLAYGSDKASYGAAVGVARRLLDLAPNAATEGDLGRVLINAANGPLDVAAPAFDLLAAKMAAPGADLLFDLATTSTSSKYAKERATKLIAAPSIRALSSPALAVALDLRASLPCARKAHFVRARDEGDARSLASLRPLAATNGCGFLNRRDCYECLGNRAELRETIAAIEARTKQ